MSYVALTNCVSKETEILTKVSENPVHLSLVTNDHPGEDTLG